MLALVAAVEAGGHSIFAPSAAHRWRRCTASLRASMRAFLLSALDVGRPYIDEDEDGTPTDSSSFFSVEGTAAHEMAEKWLRSGLEPRHLLGQEFKRDGITVVYDEEMLGYVEEYVDWCRELGPGYTAIERRVELGHLFPIPRQGGTCDHMHYNSAARRLTITDLKYGKGVRVFAEGNDQARLYALGAIGHLKEIYEGDFGLDALGIKDVVIRIAQPRLEHFDTWELDIDELHRFEDEIREQAAEAWSATAQYRPDPKVCRFCPVKATCRALAEQAHALADEAFGGTPDSHDVEIPVPGMLTLKEQAEALRWRPTLDAWMKALEADLFRRADAGDEVPYFKIVEGRSSRKWRDPKSAAEWLEVLGLDEKDIWTRTMVSPHQAELALRAKRLASKRGVAVEVISTPSPRTLAPTFDPRSALAGSADVFEPVAEDDASLD